MTAKEYALLKYLMVHAGQVGSRVLRIEHVWDQSFDRFTNIDYMQILLYNVLEKE